MGCSMVDSELMRAWCSSERAREIWCDENMIRNWIKYWVALAQAEEEQGIVPKGTAEAIREVSDPKLYDFNLLRQQMEETTHPCIPLIWQIEKKAKNGLGKWVHWGATLQDMSDTAFIMSMKETAEYHEELLEKLIARLLERAEEEKKSVMAGRTHMMHAIPMTMGMKFAIYADEMSRCLIRLRESKSRILKGMFVGGGGTVASLYAEGFDGRAVEKRLCELLGLSVPTAPWPSARDHMTEWAYNLSIMCGSIGRMCGDLQLLHKQEVGEVEEDFPRGRIGSSTLPHKRNPDTYENIWGMCWVVEALSSVAWSSMHVFHERDTSTMMADWYYTPLINITATYCLETFNWCIDTVHIYRDRMVKNIDSSLGALNAEHMLIALGRKIGRMDAHHIIYEDAMDSYEQKRHLTDIFLQDTRVTAHFSEKEIREIMDPMHYIGRAEGIVDCVKKSAGSLLKK